MLIIIKVTTLILFFLTSLSCLCQITFQKTFGGNWGDMSQCIQQTTDNGYVIAGLTSSSLNDKGEILLVKTFSNGAIEWTRTFATDSSIEVYSLKKTNDGGFLIAGVNYNENIPNCDVYFVKTDSIGNLQWSKSYAGIGIDRCLSVIEMKEGGFAAVGYTQMDGSVICDAFLLRTDINGNLLWSRTFGGSGVDAAYDISETDNGDLVVCGNYTNLYSYICLARFTSSGNMIWSKSYNTSGGGDNGNSIYQTLDKGFVVAGSTWNYTAGYPDILLLNLDNLGNFNWGRTYGGADYDYGYSVIQSNDGGFLLTGQTASFGAGGDDLYVVKTNQVGIPQWSSAFGGAGSDCYDAKGIQTSDGGYAFATYEGSFGLGNGDCYLIKTDSFGNSGCNQVTAATVSNNWYGLATPAFDTTSYTFVEVPIVTTQGIANIVEDTLCFSTGIKESSFELNYNLYPNPFTSVTKLTFNNSTNENHSFYVFDQLERKVIAINNIKTNEVIIERKNLISGIYFFQLITDEHLIATGKLVIE